MKQLRTILFGKPSFPDAGPGEKKRRIFSLRRGNCRRLRASLTLEAALAVPFFFLCMTALIAIPDLYAGYASQVTRLQQQAEKGACAATSAVLAGESGVSPVVSLPETYRYRPFALPFSFGTMKFGCRGRARAWVGYTADCAEGESDEDGIVYVTENQSVYHTDSSCTHLDLTWNAVSGSSVGRRRNTYGDRYHACEYCVAGGKAGSVVYISPAGDAFHNSASCGGLTRHVKMIKKSEAGNLPECTRCHQKDA